MAHALESCGRYALSRVRLDVHDDVLIINYVQPVEWVRDDTRLPGYEALHRGRGSASCGGIGLSGTTAAEQG
jgi:hypothetical protein